MSETKCKYLVIDTETTGFHPGVNGLIQVAMIAMNDKLEIIDTYCQDICPPKDIVIEAESLEVNGFTVERIFSGINYTEFCQQFIHFLQTNFVEKPVTIGQFYPFDYAFLEYVFVHSGYPEIVGQYLGNDIIDTKSLVNTLNLSAILQNQDIPFQSTSLSKPGGLKESLQITETFQAHDALGDVLATRAVLIKLLEMLRS